MGDDNKVKPVIVVSTAKAFVAGQYSDKWGKMRLSTDALNRLNDYVRDVLKAASGIAAEDGRTTVLARDIPTPEALP